MSSACVYFVDIWLFGTSKSKEMSNVQSHHSEFRKHDQNNGRKIVNTTNLTSFKSDVILKQQKLTNSFAKPAKNAIEKKDIFTETRAELAEQM